MITRKSPSMLGALLRNLRSSALNRELLGLTLSRELAPVSADEVHAFARATGDPAFEQSDQAPPFYVAKLAFPLIRELMVHRELRMNLLRMVHGEMAVQFAERPIRVGDVVSVVTSIDAFHDTPAGELMEVGFTATVEGTEVGRATAGMLVRGKGGQSKGGRSKGEPRPEPELPPERFRVDLPTFEGQQLEYARASGDTNFIHTSTLLAKVAGLPRTILHGMCVLAMTQRVLAAELVAGEVSQVAAIEGRFAGFVIPGQTLTVVGYQHDDPARVPYAVFTPSGRPAIKNGWLQLR